MIFDILKNSDLYDGCHKNFHQAFDFLKNYKPMPDGKYLIDGENLYANVTNDFVTSKRDVLTYEAHKNYIDIQCVLAGDELLCSSNIANLNEVSPYDSKRDIAFYEGKSNKFHMTNCCFAILFPDDAHTGGI
ncbi:MAG: YhcH/YjgK/YiaL family protein, partial [Clostridia bacterium]